jgi:signal recognition particle GTPase
MVVGVNGVSKTTTIGKIGASIQISRFECSFGELQILLEQQR